MADDYTDTLRATDFTPALEPSARRKLELYFLLHLFSTSLYTAIRRLVPADEIFPDRPDGGAWIAEGLRFPADFDFSAGRVWRYTYGGRRTRAGIRCSALSASSFTSMICSRI